MLIKRAQIRSREKLPSSFSILIILHPTLSFLGLVFSISNLFQLCPISTTEFKIKNKEMAEPLVFKVTRAAPELVPPAAPTPYEFKELSDIDDQEGLRFLMPLIFFYNNRNHSTLGGCEPAKVIKEAVAKALVPYYPFAGRLRERPGRKLVVECNAEGALFVEAHADVTLDQFKEEDLRPPIPCLEDLIFHVPASSGVLHSPLFLFQVTRLKCGGFILAVQYNHCMADAAGFYQFVNAIAELARGGGPQLSLQPVWERHLLRACDPPRITRFHHEHDDNVPIVIPTHNLAHISFFFGPNEMSAFRSWVPPHLKSSTTTFEVLSACLWRCRTIALEPKPNEVVHFIPVVNARSKINPPLPKGYYGNVLAYPAALCTANELIRNPLGYAIELIKKAKATVTNEYMRSLADLLVIKGRPRVIVTPCSFQVSDTTRAGFDQMDFGWGLPVYGGNARKAVGFASFYIPAKNKKGERGIVLPISLPAPAMERFVKELRWMLGEFSERPNNGSGSSPLFPSSL